MGVVTREQANRLDRQLMASHITSFNYSSVSSGILHGKMIHLVMSSWFLAVNVIMTHSCANATNSNAKATKSIAKLTKSIANGTNSTAKAMNSTANGMNLIAKVTNSIAKTCISIAKYTVKPTSSPYNS